MTNSNKKDHKQSTGMAKTAKFDSDEMNKILQVTEFVQQMSTFGDKTKEEEALLFVQIQMSAGILPRISDGTLEEMVTKSWKSI